MPADPVAAGVFRIPVFTPFGTDPTNAYVLRGDRVALFDTGLRHPRARADLLRGLADLGLTPADVDTVFISHGHVDHTGLAHGFEGAAVVGGAVDIGRLTDYEAHVAAFAAAVEGLLPRWGVPEAIVARLRESLGGLLEASASVPWATAVEPGAAVEGLGPPWRVVALPGHTEGGIGLLRDGDGVLLAGDHLLEAITPNPGLYTSRRPVTSGLGSYVRSLRVLSGMAIDTVLPGHGRPFSGVGDRIRAILAHHATRADEVEASFGAGRSVFQVTEVLFPGLDPLNVFLALSEVFGHAELLRDEGRLAVEGVGSEGDAAPIPPDDGGRTGGAGPEIYRDTRR